MPSTVVAPIRPIRTLAGALMAALVTIGIALAFTVGHQRNGHSGNRVQTHAPGVWVYIVIAGLGVLVAGLVQTFGYRIPALDPGLEPATARAAALRAYQQSMILRFAFSESVAIVAIALLFASDSNTILPYILAAAIAELLMAYHVWPNAGLINRVQTRLDRDGAQSNLHSALYGTA